MQKKWLFLLLLLLGSTLLVSAASNDCSFLKDPNQFSVKSEQRQMMRSDFSNRIQGVLYAAGVADASATVDPKTIARKNFIDDSIFGRMSSAGIQSSPL